MVILISRYFFWLSIERFLFEGGGLNFLFY